MNQILVTEKIYVTPELKRKKKIYKILFILSIFLIICLFSVYIYAEYDRNKEESISQDMLLSSLLEETQITDEDSENALIVLIQEDEKKEQANNNEEKKAEEAQVATATYTAPNGKEYEYIGYVNIPKIKVNYPILSTTTVPLLKVSICKFHGPEPNEVGNFCIVGHNYRNKRFFSKVPTLEVGDIVEITDLSKRTIQYEVYDIHTVIPDDNSDTTQKTNGRKEVTLITCTDDSKQRVIVKCKEKI